MTTREAQCSCGQLRLTCEGEPVRISICHCLDCQRRTGSVFGTQARFPRGQVTRIEGRAQRLHAHRRQRQYGHLPLLPGLRHDGLLGADADARRHRRGHRRLRRSRLSRTRRFLLRAPAASLGRDQPAAGACGARICRDGRRRGCAPRRNCRPPHCHGESDATPAGMTQRRTRAKPRDACICRHRRELSRRLRVEKLQFPPISPSSASASACCSPPARSASPPPGDGVAMSSSMACALARLAADRARRGGLAARARRRRADGGPALRPALAAGAFPPRRARRPISCCWSICLAAIVAVFALGYGGHEQRAGARPAGLSRSSSPA